MRLRTVAGLLAIAALMAIVALRTGSPTRAYGFSSPATNLTDQSQSYTPPTPTVVSSAKTCPNGTVEFLGSVCPLQWQTCPTGEVIYATQVCPGTTPVPGSAPVAVGPGGSSPSGQASATAAAPVTLCGSESSFNPATQLGSLAPAVTVSVGQPVLCGVTLTAGPGCQPGGESVDFGDGSQPFVSAQFQGASHTYSQPGVYSATDTISGCPASAPASLTVVPVAGLAQPTSPSGQPVQTLVTSVPVAGASSCSQPPAMPANLTVTAQPDLFHALISWTENSGDASGFQIGFGNGSVVGTAGPGVTQFSAGTWTDANTGAMDQVAPTGWWDFFSVTAINSCGSSNAAWGQVRMPCPDGSAGDPNGNATNSCSHTASSGGG